MAGRWLSHLDEAAQVIIGLRPTWAVASDMAIESPFYAATADSV